MNQVFENVKVIDFSNNIAGPVSTSMMADFGADVIKVEMPVIGEVTRNVIPKVDGYALTSWWLNRGKKSITIDLHDSEGIEVLYKLIPHMDVLVENFRPGTMKKFGLDYETVKKINPSIIYISITMYGQTGPDSQKPGFDVIAQARSGMLDLTGFKDEPPVKSGYFVGDYLTCAYGLAAISMALYYRFKSNKGQYIDLSLLDTLVASNSNIEMGAVGLFPRRMGNHHNTVAPYGIFRACNNEYVVICAQFDNIWARLCNAMGHPEYIEDERFISARSRVANLESVIEVIEKWLQSFDDVHIVVDILEKSGVPCRLVMSTQEVRNYDHLIERGMIIEDFETPNDVTSLGEKIKSRGVVIKMSETPGSIKRAPGIGEHNYEILQKYGCSKEEIDRLQNRWASKYNK